MLFSLWSAKAGAGCTAVAIALADELARRAGRCLLVDLGGDVTSCAGLERRREGLTDWLAASSSPMGALSRLEVEVGRSGVDLLPSGGAARWPAGRVEALLQLLRHEARPVVVDVGWVGPSNQTCEQRLGERLVDEADHALLVARACYLTMRRALDAPRRRDGVILVREHARSLDAYDVAQLLATPVVAQVDHDPAIARSIDAGTFVARVPKALTRRLRRVA